MLARRGVRENVIELKSQDKLGDGWNHIVLTHDLRTLRLYLNGKADGEAAIPAPQYQRTHSAPVMGFSKLAVKAKTDEAGEAFTGDIDQIEIIGTALSPDDVAALSAKGQWLAR